MEEEIQEIETLVCLLSDDISNIEKTPPPGRMEIENPGKDSSKSDQNPGGSAEIQEAQIPNILEECGPVGGEIEDAHLTKNPEKSSKDEVDGADFPKTLEKSSQDEIEAARLLDALEKSSRGEAEDSYFSKPQHESSEDETEDGLNLDDVLYNSPKDEVNFDDNSDMSRIHAIIDPISERFCKLCGRCHHDDGFCDGFSGRPMAPLPIFQHEYFLPHRKRCSCGTCNRPRLNQYGSRCPRDFFLMRSRGYRCYGCTECRERETELSPFPFLRWNEPEPCSVGAGLGNMGNTCFLNAIIQCFTHTVPFVQGLQSLKHESSSHGDEYCVLCAVCDQIEHSLVSSGRVIFPSNLVDNLNHISSFFRRYQQEDAHEFLQCLLDKLDSNWSKYEANANASSSSDNSLVKQVFGGRLVSQLHCSECDHNSYTYEPLIDLSLGIEEVDDLESALRCFTKVESIGDTEKFTCESCKAKVMVEKQLMLDQAPSVAALHLKRFKSDGVYVEKIDKRVEYPLELDLSPYTRGAMDRNEELKYELYALVVHVGFSSTSGHYFCYIRTAPNSWYRLDDSKVYRVLEFHALDQDAYILFYARKGTPWFSTFIEELRSSSDKKILNTSPKSVLVDTDRPSTSNSLEVGRHRSEALEKSISPEAVIEQPSRGLKHHDVEVQNTVGIDPQDSATGNIASFSSFGETCDEVEVGEADFDAQLSVTTSNGSSVKPLTEMRNVEDAIQENGKDEIVRLSGETCSSLCLENIIDEKTEDGVATSPRRAAQNPDIYANKEPAQVFYPIPLDYLKIAEKPPSAKKPRDKVKLDLKRKEVAKHMSKSSMPIGRRCFFMTSTMGGSCSDSSWNKKRRKHVPFWQRRQSFRKRVKINPKRVLHPVEGS